MSCAVASTAPSGGRRSTNSSPCGVGHLVGQVRVAAGDQLEAERRARSRDVRREPVGDARRLDAPHLAARLLPIRSCARFYLRRGTRRGLAERPEVGPDPVARAQPRRCPCSSPSLRGRLPRARAPAARARSPASASARSGEPSTFAPAAAGHLALVHGTTTISSRGQVELAKVRASAGPWTQARAARCRRPPPRGESLRQSRSASRRARRTETRRPTAYDDLRRASRARARGGSARAMRTPTSVSITRDGEVRTRAARPGSRTRGPRAAGRTSATESRAPLQRRVRVRDLVAHRPAQDRDEAVLNSVGLGQSAAASGSSAIGSGLRARLAQRGCGALEQELARLHRST